MIIASAPLTPASSDIAATIANTTRIPVNKPVAGRVSVIIAAYNCASTIAAAVQSCLDQTYTNTEIIVVDDGSNDATASVLDGFGSRIQIIHQANGGLASARNTGARAATGEFVAWMDGDDLAMPDRLVVQAAALVALPDVVLVSSDFSAFTVAQEDFAGSYIGTYYNAIRQLGGATNIYPSIAQLTWSGQYLAPPVSMRYGLVYKKLLHGNFVHPPTVMMRRHVFEVIGYFDESLRYNSDYDLIVRAARVGAFAFIEQSLLRYRLSSTQMSHAAAVGKIPLETAAILRKVQVDDPAIYAAHQALFRERVGQSLILAADGIAATNRRTAIVLLARGLRLHPLCHHAPRALARVLAPEWAVAAVRRLKRMLRERRQR